MYLQTWYDGKKKFLDRKLTENWLEDQKWEELVEMSNSQACRTGFNGI